MKIKCFIICIILFHFLGIKLIIGQTNYNDIIESKIFNKTDTIWRVADQSNPTVFYELNQEVITIKFSKDSSIIGDNIMQKEIGAKLLRIAESGYSDYLLPANNDYFEILKKLKDQKGIEDIVVNSIGEVNSFTPNDDDYIEQWNLIRISMPDVWDYVEVGGNSPIVVAVLDVGVEWSHEDIGYGSDSHSNIFYNTQEGDWTLSTNPSSGNDIDDDGNGYVDDWIGWDFKSDIYYNEDNDVRNTYEEHGTNIAGIISAKTHNDLGVASIGGGLDQQGVLIMPLKIGSGDAPDGSVVDDAIYYAINNGADIISMSLGLNPSSAINTAILAAENANIPVVAAAGNYNSSNVTYPASNSNVIAVGASDKNDQKASFSNYGSNLFMVAPGVDIYTTKNSNNYGVTETDGTSFSAPQVAATIALMKMINPLLTNDEIRTILKDSSIKSGGYTYVDGKSTELGYGRLNAFRAIEAVYPFTRQDYLCSSGFSFLIDSLEYGDDVTWSFSTNIELAPGYDVDDNPCVLQPKSTYNSTGWVEATITHGSSNVVLNQPLQLNPPYFEDTEFIVRDHSGWIVDPIGADTWLLSPNSYYEIYLSYFGSTSCTLSDYDFNLPPGFTITYDMGWGVRFLTPSAEDYYYATVDANTCCADDVIVQTGYLLVFSQFYSMSFSPNPSSGETIVTLADENGDFNVNTEWDIEVYDMGQSLKAKKEKIKGNKHTLNVSDWKTGVYIVRAKVNGKFVTGRLAVE